MRYDCFEGEWDELPDFGKLTPARSGTADAFDLTRCERTRHYGVVWRGFLRVARDGVYTFSVASDDGSRLYVGDTLVVDNDGLHGLRWRSGQVALKAGPHAISVIFFERTGDEDLKVYYEGPDITRQPIPPAALCHADLN